MTKSLKAEAIRNECWAAECREALARSALAEIPRLLTLLDREPSSSTFGCFDRDYWHYRVTDFPCGMSQEFVLPLALVWALELPGNPYRGDGEIRRWIEAGIRFAARSAHRDGSCDDYYPFERATGASAFSLLAMLDACALVGLTGDKDIEGFFLKRARWLSSHREAGRLSNHEALIIACLVRVAERSGLSFEDQIRARLERLLSWQSPEGWFDEYGGADPGYLSLTIGLLADVDRRRPDLELREPIARAVKFLAALVHPDGSVGGEYCSRGTVNFFPHGLEIAGHWLPEALAINDRALRPLAEGLDPCFSDDRIVGHHLWSRLIAWAEWNDRRPGPAPFVKQSMAFPEARLRVDVRGDFRLYCGLDRGAFKLFQGARLVTSDTGPALKTRDGRVAVFHTDCIVEAPHPDEILRIHGLMAWAKSDLLTPFRSVVLRLIMLIVGRFAPNLVRSLLQRRLVKLNKKAPFLAIRTIGWTSNGLRVKDEIVPKNGWKSVEQAGVGGFQVPMTTVMARVWQAAQVQPWENWSEQLAILGPSEPLIVERTFSGTGSQRCAA
jgi:hypothetical protein